MNNDGSRDSTTSAQPQEIEELLYYLIPALERVVRDFNAYAELKGGR